ncbi:MAG TPA: hypothetical protein IAB62_00175 [Candidatus Coprocola pullicola]|nr:hypothetical protein [Candidatus Coprocola pullicola]
MKKFISIASATAIALSTMTMPAFAATWYKVSNEELGLQQKKKQEL